MSQIKKILFITLSNMGDVILTLPVLDVLRSRYPAASITAMVGPRPQEIFNNNPVIQKLIIYDKHAKLREKIKLFLALRKERFDIVIDLRNTLFGALLPAQYKTSPFLIVPKGIRHMKERNLYRLAKALRVNRLSGSRAVSLHIAQQDREYIDKLLKEKGLDPSDKFMIISPGTGGATRKWDTGKLSQLCRKLAGDYKIVLVGSQAHQAISCAISQFCPKGVYDLTGLTSLSQLACLLGKALVLLTGDTGTLQIASYMNTPIVALFGPSDEYRYGPWSDRCRVVAKEVFCRPCSQAQCRFKTAECMHLIRVEDVLSRIPEVLVPGHQRQPNALKYNFKRILVARTDRIGDVVLSTPVLKALRQAYPRSYIAMMVSPAGKEVVDGNPYLDSIIVYDKDGKHKSWLRTMTFARNLKKRRFDAAVMLHPTNRVHSIAFLAGIPRRIGYDRKCGFLLSDKLKHTKQQGEKHETEYALEAVRYLGITPADRELFVAIKPDSEKWLDSLLRQEKVLHGQKLLAVHPGASCPSKIWPLERFAQVADAMAEKYGVKPVLVAGPKDISLANAVAAHMRYPAINLAGKTSVSQLASVLKRSVLFISNDSGPVHIACAVKTPVISIFGRNQKGLGPLRWGPVGDKAVHLHREVGCIECLAHNCVKQFACLKAIEVQDVVRAAEALLQTGQ